MNYRLRLTKAAQEDLEQVFDFIAAHDFKAAVRARASIEKGFELIKSMPFSCRKADRSNPFLREAIIPFGSAGYVALFEIENSGFITILALRHQREDDYY